MIIKGRPVFVYDIEVFPNVFHCACKNTETKKYHLFEISSRKNQSEELHRFFSMGKHPKAPLFCGYNNHDYDDTVINYFIELFKQNKVWTDLVYTIFKFSNDLIKFNNEHGGGPNPFSRYKGNRYFHSMDLIRMLFASKLRVGLKSLQITMNYPNVLEFEGGFGESLPEDRIDDMITYNINDVDSTEELLNRCEKDVELRLFIEKEWGIDCLSMNSVKLAEEYLAKECMKIMKIDRKTLNEMRSPADTVKLNEVILPFIKFDHPKLQEVLEDMKKQEVSTLERKGYENKFCIRNVVYSVGVGGIHSINTPGIFKPAEDEEIDHYDVASLYPSLLIEWDFSPQHLKGFTRLFADIKTERLEAKHTGQKLKNMFLKIVLNSVTGKMQSNTSWMYDPKSVFKIRINGQLILLMLVDRLLKLNVKIIQVNTDSVMFVAKKKDKEQIEKYVKEVEDMTRLTFEGDEYKAFYQYAVNDYFGILNDDSVEEKGMFITHTTIGKGMAPLIIPKAVINYFKTGQSVRDYITGCTDIKDFLMSQRVDRKFKVLYGYDPVQQINRWYASTNGRKLYKVDGDSYYNMLAKSGVTILNKFDDIPITERHINYQYYIEEANKIIRDFTQVQLSLFADEDL